MRYIALLVIIFLPWCCGAQWSNCNSPNYRHWNSVSIIDNRGAVIVGGNRTNDSIRDLIRTTNAGITWDLGFDQISPWFRCIVYPTPGTGIAVGYTGTIQKTTNLGVSWTTVTAPGTASSRDFNSIYFVDNSVGYIVGGKQKNDSMQTILKTTDGGNNWTLQRDVPGYWLNGVFFTDANNGLAVGEHGVILKTTDGGSNWIPVALTGNIASRNYNSVFLLNSNTGFAVGGWPANDSLQTILKTTNGGSSWSVVIDQLGPMLNAVTFATNATGYVVGNYGVAYNSIDTGNTWLPSALPTGGLLDTMDLNDVKFLNADYGLICGRYGKIVKYVNGITTVPVLTTLPANRVSNTSAQLNMLADASGYLTNLSFEYGPVPSWGMTVPISGTINGNSDNLDSVQLTGLIPNTFYQCRAKGVSQNGASYGEIIQFYTTDCEVPNCDFEIWDSLFFEKPAGWNYNMPLTRVSSYNGSNAVKLGPDGGALILAIPNDAGNPQGGVPFPSRPDSLVVHAMYAINPGDTAFILYLFKKNGVTFTENFNALTGTSGGNWLTLTYPVQYGDTLTPDSVMLGIISTNVFHPMPYSTSVITVDDVHFTGTTDTLPNWQFEHWDTIYQAKPIGWVSDAFKKNEGVPYLQKVSDCVTGHTAALLSTNNEGPRHLVTGDTLYWDHPAFAVAGRHQTVNLYLKFLQGGVDTLTMNLSMFKNDTMIGTAALLIDSPILAYTPFSVTIDYHGYTTIPDSANLSFAIGAFPSSGASSVYIDNISFDGFRDPTAGIKPLVFNKAEIAIYPNPAAGTVMVELPNWEASELQLLDLTGKIIYQSHVTGTRGLIDISAFSNGIYLVQATGKQNTVVKKLVIEN